MRELRAEMDAQFDAQQDEIDAPHGDNDELRDRLSTVERVVAEPVGARGVGGSPPTDESVELTNRPELEPRT